MVFSMGPTPVPFTDFVNFTVCNVMTINRTENAVFDLKGFFSFARQFKKLKS